MTRYNELMAAVKLVQSAQNALYATEGFSPAWDKALRVKDYLRAQAKLVMEGSDAEGNDMEESPMERDRR